MTLVKRSPVIVIPSAKVFAKFTAARGDWTEKSRVRSSDGTKTLSHAKELKMMGLEGTISKYLHGLHLEELDAFKSFRRLQARYSILREYIISNRYKQC